MSLDTQLGEDARAQGFPVYLTERALALVKAEGLRQAAELLMAAHEDTNGFDPWRCRTCGAVAWLEERADRLEVDTP